ncbi:methyl-CpG-binding domain protein 6 [Rhea pennata]|uniref:methyl-CpG-binding domain protein 6 n=1 Tax=Rhea pennata TaxID=8795 RepID=UPI002E270C08
MNSSDERAGADRPTCPPAGPVPVGWERKVQEGSVCYISPSGTALTSLEQTRAYLLADGTCKCGLECPLNMHKVFNFDPGAVVAGRGAPGVQGQQDMTKLCNHRRKTVAMATLYRSMEGAPGPGSRRPGAGPGLSPLFPAGGRPAVPPGAGVPPPGTVSSFPRAPPRAKTPEAAPAGDRLVPPPFPRPRDVFPGANGSPESRPPPSPRFGRRLPPPDAAAAPRGPAGRTSARTAPSPAGARENPAPPEPGGPGPCPAAANGAPQAGKDDSPVSDALTNQSSNNPPVPLDAAPEGRGFLGLPLGQLLAPPAGTAFPASSLLSAAAKAQLGGPDPAPPPSTLPPRPLAPNVLLSVAGERGLGKAARRPRRPDPEDPAARRLPPAAGAEPKGTTSPAPGQPLAALLSLLGAQGGPGGHGGPLAPLPAGDGSPCPGTGLLPACQDFNSQLLGLFGQLAASSEPTSGTPPQPKAPSHSSAPGAATSPAVTKGPLALGAGSGGEEAAGGALGCPLPPTAAAAAEPVAFVGQEQALALGGSLPPGLLLGTLPFSVALGQHPPAPGGDPEGPSLPSLLAASLLPGQPPVPLLPLGVPLPALDLLPPPPGALLSALLPLAPAGEKGPEAAAPGPEGFPALPDGPLLFSALPASLALDPALLAAGLGPPESSPGAPPSGLGSPPAAPTSTGAPPTTTEAPRGEGRAPDGPPGPPGHLHPLGPQLGSSLLGATLLGDLPALSPLLQHQPLLPPPGLPPGAGQGPLLGAASPLACLLQSLQLGPGFGPPEKPAMLSGPGARGSPSPPDRPEGPPSALEPPAPSRAEAGGASPRGGTRGGPGSRPSLKRGRRRAEGLNGETPAPRGPPSTKSPRRGAGRGRGGWGARRHFNGQAGDGGEKGAPPAAPPAPHPAWRCNGDIPAAERQLKAEEIKGNSLRLRPSRRGRRRKASAPRPSARVETPRGRGLSTEPGAGPACNVPPQVDPALARRPRPGRPVKNRRRKLLT